MDGQAVMLARDLARLMYGDDNTAPLGKLLRAYGFDFIRLGGSKLEVKTLLVDHFHLSKFDGKAAFATWQHFLIVGMYGQTEQARKVKAHLLKRETASRVADKVEESTGLSPRQVVRAATTSWDLLAQMVETGRQQAEKLAAVDEAIREHNARQLAQQQEIIDLQSQQIESLKRSQAAETTSARADAKADMALDDVNRMTVEDFIFKNGLVQQFPPPIWRGITKWLADFCQLYNLYVDKKPVVGKPWPEEKRYPLQAFQAWHRQALNRPQQIRLVDEDEGRRE